MSPSRGWAAQSRDQLRPIRVSELKNVAFSGARRRINSAADSQRRGPENPENIGASPTSGASTLDLDVNSGVEISRQCRPRRNNPPEFRWTTRPMRVASSLCGQGYASAGAMMIHGSWLYLHVRFRSEPFGIVHWPSAEAAASLFQPRH
jgi:hypothetical protein